MFTHLRYIIFFLFFIPAISPAQSLVANGSFEDENICTEYEKNCAPEAWIATSLYSNYYFDQLNKSFDGSHFIGLTAGNIRSEGRRNFARTRLICGLHKDKQYRLELYVYSPHSILDSIGIYFSSTDFMLEKRRFTDIDPQLWSADGLDDSTALHGGWKKISLTYTATGAEAYMTIGNFKRADYTGISKGEVRYDYYFFIDKVSLLPIDPDEKLCAEADSMRKEIYAENVRHDMSQKWIYYYTRNPPKPVLPPPTRVQAVERKIIDTLIIPDIFFASGSHELSPRSFSVLDSFVNKLEAYAIDSVVVEGHTDSVGGLAQNEKLSVNRAGSVGKYLSDKIPSLSGKTILRGFAFLRPAASNKTAAGRQQNRRVEIFVYRKE